jgi:thiosulfate reductase cytochrome b subunit
MASSFMPARRSKSSPTPKQMLLAKTFHWVNIISLWVMMTSGLQIYNANPVFGGRGGVAFSGFSNIRRVAGRRTQLAFCGNVILCP